MRQENLSECLDGICSNCKSNVKMVDEWIGELLYHTGKCDNCSYENHIKLDHFRVLI